MAQAESSEIRTGCAGWSIPRLYSERFGSEGTHLERYARVLPCVEINSSFYRSHRASTWARWADSVPQDFRFSVKAPKSITHETALACSQELLSAFLHEALALGDKLGPVLFQLPPKLGFDRAHAAAFLTLLRSLYTGHVVFEPRHPNWFTPEADNLFQEFRIALAAADPSPAGVALAPGGYPDLVYYRLHGSPDRYYSTYTEDFLAALAETLREQSRHAAVWCIFDNTAAGAATGNALMLASLAGPTATKADQL